MNIFLIHFYLECLCSSVLSNSKVSVLLHIIFYTLFLKFVSAFKNVSVTRVFLINYHFYTYLFLSIPFK